MSLEASALLLKALGATGLVSPSAEALAKKNPAIQASAKQLAEAGKKMHPTLNQVWEALSCFFIICFVRLFVCYCFLACARSTREWDLVALIHLYRHGSCNTVAFFCLPGIFVLPFFSQLSVIWLLTSLSPLLCRRAIPF